MIRFVPFVFGSMLLHGFVLLWVGPMFFDRIRDPGSDAHSSEYVFVSLQAPITEIASAPTPAVDPAPESAPTPESTDQEKVEEEIPPPEKIIEKPFEVPKHEESVEFASQWPILAQKADAAEYKIEPEDIIQEHDVDSPPVQKEPKEQPAEKEPVVEKRPQDRPEPEQQVVEKKPVEPKEETPQTPETPSKESTESTPQVASAATRAHVNSGKDLILFRDRVLDAIRQSIYFPKKAWRKRLHGEAAVAFVIDRSGKLVEAKLVRSSDEQIFDQAAVEIVKKASEKFPPIPGSYRGETIRYVVPIAFKRTRAAAK